MKKLLIILLIISVIGAVILLTIAPPPVEAVLEMPCNDDVAEGVFTDSRDKQQYSAFKIGDLLWMAKNLNYETDNSWCYGNANSNCEKHGRLYDFNSAKKSCPCGWHLPSTEEWSKLIDAIGNESGEAGKKLKSKILWNGTDEFGFSALPSGRYDDGEFNYVDIYASWWTATRYSDNKSLSRYMNSDSDNILENNNDNYIGFSVRCVK
jgi:uncharacterized protein (TIGR02145 family)